MKTYNINSVSRLTGLTAFVIRAWEKRYNVVTPGRTQTNRRFYSEEDVEKLKLLKEAVSKGNSIRNVADLSLPALREMMSVYKKEEQVSGTLEEVHNFREYISRSITAVKELDYRNLERYLVRSSIEFSHPVAINEIILPLLKEIGICWQKGTLRVAQEHMASAVIRTFLYNLKDYYKPSETAPKILITTPIGQDHEFGALTASLIASAEGWESVYLGPDLPSAEIVAAAEQIQPRAVALSIVYVTEDKQLMRELQTLQYLSPGIRLVVGGAGSVLYKDVIERISGTILSDMNSFREFLREVQSTTYNVQRTM